MFLISWYDYRFDYETSKATYLFRDTVHTIAWTYDQTHNFSGL